MHIQIHTPQKKKKTPSATGTIYTLPSLVNTIMCNIHPANCVGSRHQQLGLKNQVKVEAEKWKQLLFQCCQDINVIAKATLIKALYSCMDLHNYNELQVRSSYGRKHNFQLHIHVSWQNKSHSYDNKDPESLLSLNSILWVCVKSTCNLPEYPESFSESFSESQ